MSSPPRATKVTSSWRPQIAAREKNEGLSSRSAARPAREDRQVTRPCVVPSRRSTPEAWSDPPRRAIPPRRLEEQTTSSRHLFDGSDHPDADSL
jgi:soluble lytic murein transglycosylase-like protein